MGERVPEGVPALEAARHRGPSIVFLGLDETQHAHALTNKSSTLNESTDLDLALAQFPTPEAALKMMERLPGIPYFALDVSELSEQETKAFLERALADRRESKSS